MSEEDEHSSEDERTCLMWRGLRGLFEDDVYADQSKFLFALVLELDGEDVPEEVALSMTQDPLLASRKKPVESASAEADRLAKDAGITEEESATGAVVWDSAVVLAKLLEVIKISHDERSPLWPVVRNQQPPSQHSGLWAIPRPHAQGDAFRVLELGAGLGLVSIALWNLWARDSYKQTTKQHNPVRVTVTDRQEMLPLLSQNIASNCKGTRPPRITSCLWGRDLRHLEGPFDLIICCDLVYDVMPMFALLHSLKQLCHRDSVVLFAIDEAIDRPVARKFFRRLVTPWFERRDVPRTALHPEYTRQSVQVFTLHPIASVFSHVGRATGAV